MQVDLSVLCFLIVLFIVLLYYKPKESYFSDRQNQVVEAKQISRQQQGASISSSSENVGEMDLQYMSYQ